MANRRYLRRARDLEPAPEAAGQAKKPGRALPVFLGLAAAGWAATRLDPSLAVLGLSAPAATLAAQIAAVPVFGLIGYGVGRLLQVVFGTPGEPDPQADERARQAAGRFGEDWALTWLDRLDEEHYLLRQVCVPTSRSRTGYREIDLLVVGPGGIVPVEVKHCAGTVVLGDPRASHWDQHRPGPRGEPQHQLLRNPLSQVVTAARALEHWLRRQGVRAHIKPLVLFTHPTFRWVLHAERRLEDYREASMARIGLPGPDPREIWLTRRRLTPEEVERIARLLYERLPSGEASASIMQPEPEPAT